MPSYRLPTFNLVVNIWHTPPGNITLPPDVVTVGNLSPGKLVSQAISPGQPLSVSPYDLPSVMILRLPPLTDIRDHFEVPFQEDIVEVPAGTGRYYKAFYVDDIGKGFANEHRFAYLTKADRPWPTPIP